MTVDLTAAGSSLDHQALFYADPDEYLMVIDAFVRAAAASGSAVLVAVPGKKLVRLQEALAELGDAVRFTDLAVAGRNPGRILPDVLAFADAQRGRRVAIVGEPVWPGRSDLELAVCAQHEALVNAAFAGRDATILCPYDAGVLQEAQLRDARHAHPVLITGGVRRPSPFYTDAVTAAAAFNRPLPVIPAWAAVLTFATVAELSAVRGFVGRQAAAADLAPDAAEDLVAAVNELAENTILHTGAGGTLSVWPEDGRLVCQVDDTGHLTDPLAGRIPRLPTSEGGRGLLLANQLCDLVRIHTTPAGTSIRLHMNSGAAVQ